MSEMQPQTPALDSVQERLRRNRRLGLIWILVGLACFAVMVVTANIMESHSSRLEQAGLHTLGTVLQVQRAGRLSEGSIDISFRIGDVEHTARINLNSDSPRYSVGDTVDVIFDPRNVSDVRTSEEPNDPSWGTPVLALGLLGAPTGWAVGWTLMRRSRRWRKLLAAGPWRRIEASYAVLRRGNFIQPLVRLTEGSTTVVRGTTSAFYQGVDELKWATSVWACGSLAGRMVITPEIGGRLFEVRPARTARKQRRWIRKFITAPES